MQDTNPPEKAKGLGQQNLMPCVLCVCTVLICYLGLLDVTSGLPAQATRIQVPMRLQCPSCLKDFKTAAALRKHCAALLKPGDRCGSDHRDPIVSGWSSQGPRSAGMAQNLNRPARLLGLEDSDSDSQGDRDTGAGGVEAAGRQSPLSPPDDVPAADPAPAAPAPPVHINTYRYNRYTQIYTQYIQIHTDTYWYIHL